MYENKIIGPTPVPDVKCSHFFFFLNRLVPELLPTQSAKYATGLKPIPNICTRFVSKKQNGGMRPFFISSKYKTLTLVASITYLQKICSRYNHIRLKYMSTIEQQKKWRQSAIWSKLGKIKAHPTFKQYLTV